MLSTFYLRVNYWEEEGGDLVQVPGKPAYAEDAHDNEQHLDRLEITKRKPSEPLFVA